MSQPPPEHVIDLDHSLNRATIEGAKPGEAIFVLVKEIGSKSASTERAIGRLSSDGSEFKVEVPTPSGKLSHTWPWDLLLAAIRVRGKS